MFYTPSVVGSLQQKVKPGYSAEDGTPEMNKIGRIKKEQNFASGNLTNFWFQWTTCNRVILSIFHPFLHSLKP